MNVFKKQFFLYAILSFCSVHILKTSAPAASTFSTSAAAVSTPNLEQDNDVETKYIQILLPHVQNLAIATFLAKNSKLLLSEPAPQEFEKFVTEVNQTARLKTDNIISTFKRLQQDVFVSNVRYYQGMAPVNIYLQCFITQFQEKLSFFLEQLEKSARQSSHGKKTKFNRTTQNFYPYPVNAKDFAPAKDIVPLDDKKKPISITPLNRKIENAISQTLSSAQTSQSAIEDENVKYVLDFYRINQSNILADELLKNASEQNFEIWEDVFSLFLEKLTTIAKEVLEISPEQKQEYSQAVTNLYKQHIPALIQYFKDSQKDPNVQQETTDDI